MRYDMINEAEKFESDKYLHLKNVISKEEGVRLSEFLKAEAFERGVSDIQCPISKSVADNKVFNKLLFDLLPRFEAASGKRLFPTYTFSRWYVPGEKLALHLDRPSCEISATVTLGFDGDVWPIYIGEPSYEPTEFEFEDFDKNRVFCKNVSRIDMNIGDAMIYRGCEMYHWRDEYTQGQWQAQVFLHYVDADGPNAEWKFDKRSSIPQ